MSESNGVPATAKRLTREELQAWLDRKPAPGNWRTWFEPQPPEEDGPEDDDNDEGEET